jgi:hypothetical protein
MSGMREDLVYCTFSCRNYLSEPFLSHPSCDRDSRNSCGTVLQRQRGRVSKKSRMSLRAIIQVSHDRRLTSAIFLDSSYPHNEAIQKSTAPINTVLYQPDYDLHTTTLQETASIAFTSSQLGKMLIEKLKFWK